MLFVITTANAQQQTLTVYFTVDMSSAMLGGCTSFGDVDHPCINGLLNCPVIPFDGSIDVVEPMGMEYNGWNSPTVNSNCADPSLCKCGEAYTHDVTTDMQPVSPGSLIYTITDPALTTDLNGYTTFKYRIDHSWDNDELRGIGDANRHAKIPFPATSVLITSVFDDSANVIANVSGISNPVLASIQKIYPNPSSDISRIAYNVLQPGNVQVYISDAVGRKVMVLVDQNLSFGTHETTVNTSDLNTGMYLVTVQIGSSTVTQKLTVAR